jgi:predicted dehydrogenase
MANAPLRVGLVGANPERGWAKDAHVPALRVLPRFKIEGTSARTRETAEAAAQAFGAAQAFNDTFELIRSPDIDVVVVTVKVPEHLAIVLAALEAGKHIYCEWPLGKDVAEAEQMAAAAKGAKGKVIIGVQGTGAPAVRQADAILRSGAMGRLQTARIVSPTAGWAPQAPPFYEYLNHRKYGATMTAIQGGHTLAAVEMLLGRFTEVTAQNTIQVPQVRIIGTDEFIERDCPDHVAIIGRHESGCVSTVEVCGGRNPTTPFVFEIIGEKGEIRISGLCAGGYQTGVLKLETTLENPPPAPEPVGPGLKGPPANVAELYAQLAASIDTGVQHGYDFDYAAHLTRVLAGLDRASDTGTRQDLKGA